MKTTILLLATWLCMAYSLLAQPVYDACATPPQPGEIWMEETTVCDDNGVTPGPSGSNVVWDFSNWNVQTSYSGIDTFYATASLPQSSSFPTSNLTTVRGDMRLFWDYSPSGISHCGSYFSYYNHYNIYSDLNKFMKCPQHFQDDFYETYDYVTSPSLFFHGGKTTTYDGYGKLILPGHTYQDVIRIHSLDTVFQSGGYELFDNYLWIETTNFRHVCSISKSTVFGVPGSYTYVNYYTHTYLGMLPTANAQPLPQVQIFPNPTSGQLRIEGEGFEKGLVTVTSLTGQVVKHLAIHSTEVDLSELPSGMYLYSVQDVLGEVVKTGKLVKQ